MDSLFMEISKLQLKLLSMEGGWMLGSGHGSWLLHMSSSQQPCEVWWLPFDILKVENSEVHLMEGKSEAQQVQASSPRDLNLPEFRAQMPHYYDFPLAAKSKLFPLQANWAGLRKVPWIPNGRDMKEKRVGTDQAICHGMCGIFAALAQGEKQYPL